MTAVRVIWKFQHLVLDSRTFSHSLYAHRYVRKQLATLPSTCHAKWQHSQVTVMNGPEIHSTFTLEVLR